MTTPTTNQNGSAVCPHLNADLAHPFFHSICATCKLRMCEDCEVLSGICSCCGGSICEYCKVNARQRQKIEDNRSVTEYLCKGCTEKQDAARLALSHAIGALSGDTDGYAFIVEGWLSDVISDLEQAISEAKEAL